MSINMKSVIEEGEENPLRFEDTHTVPPVELLNKRVAFTIPGDPIRSIITLVKNFANKPPHTLFSGREMRIDVVRGNMDVLVDIGYGLCMSCSAITLPGVEGSFRGISINTGSLMAALFDPYSGEIIEASRGSDLHVVMTWGHVTHTTRPPITRIAPSIRAWFGKTPLKNTFFRPHKLSFCPPLHCSNPDNHSFSIIHASDIPRLIEFLEVDKAMIVSYCIPDPVILDWFLTPDEGCCTMITSGTTGRSMPLLGSANSGNLFQMFAGSLLAVLRVSEATSHTPGTRDVHMRPARGESSSGFGALFNLFTREFIDLPDDHPSRWFQCHLFAPFAYS